MSELDTRMPPPPARIGQATHVEASRAAAEVAGAITVARQFPRDDDQALAWVAEACGRKETAETAFYAFPRDGATITGPTIQLARVLAAGWQNVQHGIDELSRDDEGGVSEIKAWAWDVERNVRASLTTIVPHVRFTKTKGRSPLIDPRDIYENNTNAGARRLRECIFAVLPKWYTARAEEMCHRTLALDIGDVTTEARKWVGIYRDRVGVTQVQLEANVGRPLDRWTVLDVVNLRIKAASIASGELRAEDEFPPPQVTGDEIRAQAAATAAPAKRAARKQTPPPDVPADAEVQDPPPGVDPETGELDPTLDPSWGKGGDA